MGRVAAALLALALVACAPQVGPLPSGAPSASPAASDADQVSPRATLRPGSAGLGNPVDLVELPGDGRLLIADQAGRLLLVDAAAAIAAAESGGVAVEPSLVADLRAGLSTGGERGLLGVALHPRFGAPGEERVYINYTRAGDGATVIAVARLDVARGMLRGAPLPLLAIEQPYANHNGGDLLFRDDGLLVIPTGDGGSAGDPQRRAQDPASLLGKVLLLDAEAAERAATGTGPAVRPSIWMSGVRNPWRVTFDPRDGALWIADVGQGTTEEVTRLPAGPARDGANLGWRTIEGDRCYGADACSEPPGYAPPIGVYRHEGGACSVSGGALADDPAGRRWYLFADWCDGKIRGISAGLPADRRVDDPLATVQLLGEGQAQLAAIVADASGRTWALDHGGGQLLLLTLEVAAP